VQSKIISAQELVFLQEQGAAVLDIRPEDEFDKGHIPGALNVPFYRPIQGWTPWQAARRVAFAAFGILKGTEVNPNFESEVKELVQPSSQLIIYCR
jgi:rhodanese-related sulfurtransferase